MRLCLGNLPTDVNEAVIRAELLSDISSITAVKLVNDPRTGRSRGFAFIDLVSQTDADIIVKRLSGVLFRNKKLLVSYAKEITEPNRKAPEPKPTENAPALTKSSRRENSKQSRRRNSDDEFNGPWR